MSAVILSVALTMGCSTEVRTGQSTPSSTSVDDATSTSTPVDIDETEDVGIRVERALPSFETELRPGTLSVLVRSMRPAPTVDAGLNTEGCETSVVQIRPWNGTTVTLIELGRSGSFVCTSRTMEVRESPDGTFVVALTRADYSDPAFADIVDGGYGYSSSAVLAYLGERNAEDDVLARFDIDEAAGTVTLGFASGAELIFERP